jgi:hypothetical protein
MLGRSDIAARIGDRRDLCQTEDELTIAGVQIEPENTGIGRGRNCEVRIRNTVIAIAGPHILQAMKINT